MDNLRIEQLLFITAAIVGLQLLIIAWLLKRKQLFNWMSSGFWTWVAFALYFVLNPLTAVLQGNINVYRIRLFIVGGTDRGYWILFVIVVCITIFFFSYLHTKPSSNRVNPREVRFTPPMVLAYFIFTLIGVYSLVIFRASIITTKRDLLVEGNRFTGEVTGYESSGYMFLFIPILLLLLSKSIFARVLGYVVALLFLVLALPNGWSRYLIVSLLIAVSLTTVIRLKKNWPSPIYLPLLLIFTIVLQMRGHVEWHIKQQGSELLSLVINSTKNIGSAFGSSDASMLASWYLESFVKDEITGYDYGLPLVNYLFSAWLPHRFFPHKYFLVDWLRGFQTNVPESISVLLYGAKSTLVGSFYADGGILGVIIITLIAGYLSRKLDGMLYSESHILAKATGIAWMSVLWIIWGSNSSWGVLTLGILSFPAIVLWILSPKKRYSHPFIQVVDISGIASD
jgi:hypothetical protein